MRLHHTWASALRVRSALPPPRAYSRSPSCGAADQLAQAGEVGRLLEAARAHAVDEAPRALGEHPAGEEDEAIGQPRREAHGLGVELHDAHSGRERVADDDVEALAPEAR